MAKIPPIKRIVMDSLEDYEDLREPVFGVLNHFMENVVRAFNNRLTFSENFDGAVLTFQADGNYPLKLGWSRSSKPAAIWIGKVSRVDGRDSNLSSALTLDWSFNQSGQIEISDIVGLPDSPTNKFNITIIGVTG